MENSKEPRFDYLFIGTGNSALTAAALLVNAGKRVLMLEAHDIPGGYAQSFPWGEEYFFCAQVHYIWGCGPGGKIYEFLKKVGLEKDITFQLYDPEGYDRVHLPDGKLVNIPYGYEKLIENVEAAYPGNRAGLEKFTKILTGIRKELRNLPEKIKWYEYITKGWQFPYLIKYRNSTLQDVFDECKLSKEAQAVLAGNAGDFMLPPSKLSVGAYVGLFAGYGCGAYYPTKHYKYYFERVAQFIEEHRGSRILYKSEVAKINAEGDKITSVETKDGRTFTAKTIVCNMDPKKAAEMIGMEKFPASYQKKLQYKQSGSSVIIYLGLKNIDLKKLGLGKFNIWHYEQWDVNKTWNDQDKGDFSKPWFFLSTASLHTDVPPYAPKGNHIIEIATSAQYDEFNHLKNTDMAAYEKRKAEVAEHLLDLVEKHYIPNLREHIDVKVVGTPTSNEYWVWAPEGNAYGQNMTPAEVGPKRLRRETPFSNFYFCNATAGYASIYGTTGNGIDLYMQLTGDKFYSYPNGPTDEEFIAQARRDFTEQNKGK